MKRFFGQPMTLWPSMRNRLHVYLLPDEELRAALVAKQKALEGFDYCSVQPAAYLHATVQQFAVTTEQVTPEQLEAFARQLARFAADLQPFDIPLAAPVADDWSLGVRGLPSAEWHHVVNGVRAAAAETINLGHEMPKAPFGPHLTLGYGVADGSSEQIQLASDSLNDSRNLSGLTSSGGPNGSGALAGSGLPPLRVNKLHLLAVHQDVEAGIFHWDSSETFSIG